MHRCQEYALALDTYEKILQRGEGAGIHAYCAVIRAAVACRPLDDILDLFNKCYTQHGYKVSAVVGAALCALTSENKDLSAKWLIYADRWYEWLINNNVRPTMSILVNFLYGYSWFSVTCILLTAVYLIFLVQNQLLGIASIQGTDADVETALQRIKQHRKRLNGDTYNTLLRRHATNGDQSKALGVLQQMHTAGHRADQYTYNQLLKLYMVLNNLVEAEKVYFRSMFSYITLSRKQESPYYISSIHRSSQPCDATSL